jgi:hypothetical protein
LATAWHPRASAAQLTVLGEAHGKSAAAAGAGDGAIRPVDETQHMSATALTPGP